MTTTGPPQAAGVTAGLAAWVAGLRLDDVPEPVSARAKHLLLDGVGGWPGRRPAAVVPGCHRRRAVDRGRLAASVVMGTGQTTSGPAAVLLNSTFIQGFELDDFHPVAPLHGASLVLPVLLTAAADDRSTDGRAFLTAVAGFETGPAGGPALHGAQMLSRGWHSGPVFGTHAAAMAAGKLRGLDAGPLEDALGLAATQSAGLMAAQFEAMSKRMQHGFAARNGFYPPASPPRLHRYQGRFRAGVRRFLAVFGEGHAPVPAEITADLGPRWETELIWSSRTPRRAASTG